MFKFFKRKTSSPQNQEQLTQVDPMQDELMSYKVSLQNSEEEVLALRRFISNDIPDGDQFLQQFFLERKAMNSPSILPTLSKAEKRHVMYENYHLRNQILHLKLDNQHLNDFIKLQYYRERENLEDKYDTMDDDYFVPEEKQQAFDSLENKYNLKNKDFKKVAQRVAEYEERDHAFMKSIQNIASMEKEYSSITGGESLSEKVIKSLENRRD